MRLGEPDASGRREPIRIPDSTFRIPVSGVVSAIGETVDGVFPEGLRALAAGDLAGIFIAGDAATGEGTVTAAVGSGRRTAARVDAYLRNGRAPERRADAAKPVAAPGQYSRGRRSRTPESGIFFARTTAADTTKTCQSPTSFAELVEGFGAGQALSEARRCLACGTCNGCLNCYYWCPDMAIHGCSENDLQIDFGALQRMRNMR